MRWGEFDFRELKQFATNLKGMQKVMPVFIDNCVKELAARLLAKVVPRTPVGETGDLRRGWTIGQLHYEGDTVSVEVINPVDYSLYVEYGHRTANHAGWVEGRFMLTISEQELERELPGIIQKRLEKLIHDHLG
jgi:hypothetical protein